MAESVRQRFHVLQFSYNIATPAEIFNTSRCDNPGKIVAPNKSTEFWHFYITVVQALQPLHKYESMHNKQHIHTHSLAVSDHLNSYHGRMLLWRARVRKSVYFLLSMRHGCCAVRRGATAAHAAQVGQHQDRQEHQHDDDGHHRCVAQAQKAVLGVIVRDWGV